MAHFFSSKFLGMIVDFPETRWKLLTKIEEEVEQNFEEEDKEEQYTSFSSALFSCETPANDSNTSRKALMKIWMQIPFKGSEFEPPATKAVQASQELPLDAEYELKALQRLLAIDSLHTPKLLACKQETQPNDWMVPGGFIFFLVFSEMPGVALQRKDQLRKESLYWAQSSSTRSVIRRAFKKAWQDLLAAGACPVFPGLKNLQWDGPLPASPIATDQGNM
ncbi:hypothetical protein V8E54_008060 [Elaphomyces granulatus]